MKIARIIMIIGQLSATAPVAFSNDSDGCYYTSTAVCKAKGTVVSSTAVACRSGSLSATLYNQVILDAPTYRYVAASGTDGGDSRQGKVRRSYDNTVPCTTTTVDPATCNISIRPMAVVARVVCDGEAADPNARKCQFARNAPAIQTDQALAILTQ